MANHNTQRYHSMRDAYRQVYLQEKMGIAGKVLGKALQMGKKAAKSAMSPSDDDNDDLIAQGSGTQKESVSIMPMRAPMVVKQTTNIDLELTPEYKGPGEVTKAYYTYPAGFDPTGRQDVVKGSETDGSKSRSEKKVNENRMAAYSAGESEGKKMLKGSGPAKVSGKGAYTMKGKDGKPLFGKEEVEYSELELVCDKLLDEGLVDTPEAAEAFWNHMSDEWRETLVAECWKTHERVPGTVPGSKGSCRPKGSAKKEEFDNFVHELVAEGHDLSMYSVEQVEEWYYSLVG